MEVKNIDDELHFGSADITAEDDSNGATDDADDTEDDTEALYSVATF